MYLNDVWKVLVGCLEAEEGPPPIYKKKVCFEVIFRPFKLMFFQNEKNGGESWNWALSEAVVYLS